MISVIVWGECDNLSWKFIVNMEAFCIIKIS